MPAGRRLWSADGDRLGYVSGHGTPGPEREWRMDLNIDQLFTADSLLTLQGAAAVTYLVPNVLGTIIPMPDRVRALIALIIALALSFLAATLGEQQGALTWVV